MAKGFTQGEGIDHNETFFPVSCKDSFRIILVAHHDLELHQMDVKTAFLNRDLYEKFYMAQPKGFVMEGKENLSVPPEEIDLWLEASLEAVVLAI